MSLKSIVIHNFLPPETDWPEVPQMSMDLGESCTCLAMCEDGVLLAVLHLPAHKLANAIKQDGLFQRIIELKQKSEWAYVLISEGLSATSDGSTKVGKVDTKWAWSAVQGALATVQELGVVIVHIQEESDVGPTVARLAKRDRSTKRLKPARDAEFLSPGEQMLLALPGIGETNLMKILGYCGSITDSLMALTDPNVSIPGIGNKTKQAVRDALGLLDDQYLCPISVNDMVVDRTIEKAA